VRSAPAGLLRCLAETHSRGRPHQINRHPPLGCRTGYSLIKAVGMRSPAVFLASSTAIYPLLPRYLSCKSNDIGRDRALLLEREWGRIWALKINGYAALEVPLADIERLKARQDAGEFDLLELRACGTIGGGRDSYRRRINMVTTPGSEQFEQFDVTAEVKPEAPIVLASLGGFTDSEDELRSLLVARDEIEHRFMKPAGAEAVAASAEEPYDPRYVVGVGIGLRTVNGNPTDRLVVKVLVKEKKAQNELSSEALVPPTVGGVPTDVEECGEIYPNQFTVRRRPAPGGVSMSSFNESGSGTIACLVKRSNQVFILSCNHVIGLTNQQTPNAEISQPGSFDKGWPPFDTIAYFTESIKIDFTPGSTNTVDAAIARIRPPDLQEPQYVDRRILRVGGILQPIALPAFSPELKMQVQKSGRTTEYTSGTIDVIKLTQDIPFPNRGSARFVDQFLVGGAFSKKGDSGSLVTTLFGNHPVGLLFAGDDVKFTYCNPIITVLDAFGVTIEAGDK
jgi:hypothetical protein